jgi:hypothetical protein
MEMSITIEFILIERPRKTNSRRTILSAPAETPELREEEPCTDSWRDWPQPRLEFGHSRGAVSDEAGGTPAAVPG